MEKMNEINSYKREGEHKRQYARLKKHFITHFQIRDDKDKGGNSNLWEAVILEDLGAGGALFNYNKIVDIGAVINLKIKFPTSAKPICCVGRIIRIQQEPGACIHHIATTFTEIDEQAKEQIQKTAERLLLRKSR
ncbi:PilZ domain-containing protein [Candidatus Omnitrophota bacterium]